VVRIGEGRLKPQGLLSGTALIMTGSQARVETMALRQWLYDDHSQGGQLQWLRRPGLNRGVRAESRVGKLEKSREEDNVRCSNTVRCNISHGSSRSKQRRWGSAVAVVRDVCCIASAFHTLRAVYRVRQVMHRIAEATIRLISSVERRHWGRSWRKEPEDVTRRLAHYIRSCTATTIRPLDGRAIKHHGPGALQIQARHRDLGERRKSRHEVW